MVVKDFYKLDFFVTSRYGDLKSSCIYQMMLLYHTNFYLKLDKKNLIRRKNKRLYSNKFDKKYFGQFSRIQKNYEEISKIKISERKFVTIDASLSANEVHEKIILNLKKCKLIK